MSQLSANFSKIADTLDQLALQAAQRDRERGEHHQALFDNQLFHNSPKLLTPCVIEAKGTYDAIIREQQAKRLTALRAEYLSEKLLAQVSAIKRELSTQTIRQSEIKHKSHYQAPISQLYQSLAQHQAWEVRLKDLVAEKTQQLNLCDWQSQASAQQALLTAEERLKRCQQAKLKIEKQITYREQHNPSNDY